jgi:hypothetical protein
VATDPIEGGQPGDRLVVLGAVLSANTPITASGGRACRRAANLAKLGLHVDLNQKGFGMWHNLEPSRQVCHTLAHRGQEADEVLLALGCRADADAG